MVMIVLDVNRVVFNGVEYEPCMNNSAESACHYCELEECSLAKNRIPYLCGHLGGSNNKFFRKVEKPDGMEEPDVQNMRKKNHV